MLGGACEPRVACVAGVCACPGGMCGWGHVCPGGMHAGGHACLGGSVHGIHTHPPCGQNS